MKKLIALFTTIIMVLSFAACGSENTDSPETTTEAAYSLPGITTSVDVLSTIWSAMPEDMKFSSMGGTAAAPVDNAPGEVPVSDTDTLSASLVCSSEAAAMIDGAASLIHMMNANNFTGAAYHLADSAYKDAFVTAMKASISGNQWMCGFPEKLFIASISDYVVVAFGAADLIDAFKTATATFNTAVTEIDEAII